MTPTQHRLNAWGLVAAIVLAAAAAAVLWVDAVEGQEAIQNQGRAWGTGRSSPSKPTGVASGMERTVTGQAGGRPATVHSERKEAAHANALVTLHLARICKLEAEARLTDCTALYHIGRKRFGDDWLAGLLRYSKLYQRTTPRARRIATAPAGPIPGASKRENARWAKLRQHAAELVAGEHPDPCPRAIHWGGTMDVPRAGTVPATCAAQGQTANVLYRLEGR